MTLSSTTSSKKVLILYHFIQLVGRTFGFTKGNTCHTVTGKCPNGFGVKIFGYFFGAYIMSLSDKILGMSRL